MVNNNLKGETLKCLTKTALYKMDNETDNRINIQNGQNVRLWAEDKNQV